ncbi:MAG: threonine ammonia-lyase [Planctomycetes bacterium]|nr:threonine ammonia-lyase [Planctomycetota bacterium]
MDTATIRLTPETALPELRRAAERLAPYVRRTPTVFSHSLSEATGQEVWLKLENLQRTGSFKIRGALNKVLSLPRERLERGLVAASAGNHAQGVALAARLAGARATIVMPLATPIVKIQRTEGYGAEVVLHGASYDEAQTRAGEIATERGATLVHPFDDEAILIGQGTIGIELLEDAEGLDAVVVPIGGGGLAAGMALAIKARSPSTRVIGVQAAGAAPTVTAFRTGSPARVAAPQTIADGIRVGVTGTITLDIIRRTVDECVTVEEDEIVDAVVQTMEKSKVVAEAAGVAGVAAILARKVGGARRVASVISGGNIDLNLIARILENGLERAGRIHHVRVRVADTPGQLARLVGIVAHNQCNVLDVQHLRTGWQVPLGFVDIDLVVETRRSEAGHQLDAALRAAGFTTPGG